MINFFLFLTFSLPLCAQDGLTTVETRSKALQQETQHQVLSDDVTALRQSFAPLERRATENEREKIVQSIFRIEAAKMLVDGNVGYDFSKNYKNLEEVNTPAEQHHYSFLFWIIRASHLLLESPQMDFDLVHKITLHTAAEYDKAPWLHAFLKLDKNKKSLGFFYNVLKESSASALSTFEYTKTRNAERSQDIKARPSMDVDFTQEQQDWVRAVSEKKGIPFSRDVIPLGKYTFHRYEQSTSGYCVFYGTRGAYPVDKGRGPGDRALVENYRRQIIANIDDPVVLRLLEKSVIDDWTKIMTGKVPSAWTHPATDINAFKNNTQTPPKDYTNTNYSRYAKNILIASGYKENEVPTSINKETLKKIVNHELSKTSRGWSEFHWVLTYMDIIAYLNGLNLIEITQGAIKSHSCFMFQHGINVFITGNTNHVSRLVRHDNTDASLIAYIQAREHEKYHGY
ncbi:MAG: hypothetical protein K2X98_04395 [Alphaproteobacteria bacterium]|nr:hypothetical protein [Alphaproteobacteria bacterium]